LKDSTTFNLNPLWKVEI